MGADRESTRMKGRIRIIRHETVPKCGSYEVRFPDGRAPKYFYWDDIPGRRLQPGTVDSATAKQAAQTLARVEQLKLDVRSRR
jgi:hypothetical protein